MVTIQGRRDGETRHRDVVPELGLQVQSDWSGYGQRNRGAGLEQGQTAGAGGGLSRPEAGVLWDVEERASWQLFLQGPATESLDRPARKPGLVSRGKRNHCSCCTMGWGEEGSRG